ncbi:MAG: hemin receptor [Prevotella sp.]|nr:hemin receptor [Prevotella sp.]
MKRYIFSLFALAALQAGAQETYENAKIMAEDLNGTARYVGMGGAMDALGADISTIGTNPAGIGLFRRSTANVSFGLVSQGEGKSFANGGKTNASFDQIGFVVASKSGNSSFVNFAFNYHKSRNFDYILSAANSLNHASQHKLSYIKAVGDRDATGQSTFAIVEKNGYLYGDFYWTSQLDNLYYNSLIYDANAQYGYNDGTGFELNRAHTGYIGEYDFNLSGNINDRVFLGMTIGIKDVHYKAYGEYTDHLIDAAGSPVGDVTVYDDRKITGSGFDVKIGAIFRPVEDSPLRFGLSIATPTFYDLKTRNYTYLGNNTSLSAYNANYATSQVYEYKLYTPWKFGISAGHTVGDYLALGIGYEYADYSSADTRENTGSEYDWWSDSYYDRSKSDEAMNRHTEKTLKGVSTLKIGAEYKAIPELAFRLGYNYVSPMYKSDGYKDVYVDSYGTNYSTTTDYTNWEATHRLTLGLGYAFDNHFSVDVAYQFSYQKGNFYPFRDDYVDDYYQNQQGKIVVDEIDNYADATKINNKRHQLLVTLGYRF